MKLLITGATGLLGSEIVRQAHIQDIPVNYLTTRKAKIQDDPKYNGFYWNPRENYMDYEALNGVTHIINLAGATIFQRWTEESKNVILQSRVLSASTLQHALEQNTNQVSHVVNASAIGIYPTDFTDKQYNEDADVHAHNFLADVVEQWELAADKIGKAGVGVCKVRIGIILSNDGGALPKMTQPVRYGIGAGFASGNQWQSWIHIEDLARLFLECCREEYNGIYNGVAPEPIRNREMIETIGRVLNRPVWLPNIPEFVLKLMMGEMRQVLTSSNNVSSDKVEKTGFFFKFQEFEAAARNLLT